MDWQAHYSAEQAGDPMYNRYIPQPDGTYLRSRIPEPRQRKIPEVHIPPTVPEMPISETDESRSHAFNQNPTPFDGITSMLHQLLPRKIDTGDLMVMLLLLLIAGDCEKDKNNALLTLALYFFM